MTPLRLHVLLLAVVYPWTGRLRRRALPAAWVVLVAGHYLAVTAPGLYGREFNLYWDSQHLGNVAAVLGRAAPWWLIATVVGALALAVGLVFVLARFAIGHVAAGMAHARSRLLLGAAAGALSVLWAAQLWGGVPAVVSFENPVTPAYVRQARYVLATFGPGATAPALGPSRRSTGRCK